MRQILTLASREIQSHISNLWMIIAAGLLFGANAMIIGWGGSEHGAAEQDLRALYMALLHTQLYLVSLLGIVLSYDRIIGERESGSLDLLRSYGLSWTVLIVGKWLGAALVLALVILPGVLLPTMLLPHAPLPLDAVLSLTVHSWLLGMVFVAVGLFVSTFVRQRSTAIVLGIVLWVVQVFAFDLIVVGLISAGTVHFSARLLNGLFLMNPVEVFRFAGLRAMLDPVQADLFGLGLEFPSVRVLRMVLILWTILPLPATVCVGRCRQ